jgi:hypothetical protein
VDYPQLTAGVSVVGIHSGDADIGAAAMSAGESCSECAAHAPPVLVTSDGDLH